MSIKTITKFACFVILLSFVTSCAKVSFGGAEHAEIGTENGGFQKAEVIARISSREINESSGLAVSKCQSDVFWTHNDSGGGPFIYAFNSKGEPRGTFRVPNVTSVDWEDIATIKTANGCFLFIGEIGDNDRRHDTQEIIRIPEPAVSSESVYLSRKQPLDIATVAVLRFRYPDEKHDAEALLVEPSTQNLYVVTKQFSGPAKVYRISPDFDSNEVLIATKISEISLPANPKGFVTGGDVSTDGRHVLLCDYYAGYELQLSSNSADFNDIWKQKPSAFDLGPREIGESIAFGSDSDTVFATTEGLNAPLIRVARKQK